MNVCLCLCVCVNKQSNRLAVTASGGPLMHQSGLVVAHLNSGQTKVLLIMQEESCKMYLTGHLTCLFYIGLRYISPIIAQKHSLTYSTNFPRFAAPSQYC